MGPSEGRRSLVEGSEDRSCASKAAPASRSASSAGRTLDAAPGARDVRLSRPVAVCGRASARGASSLSARRRSPRAPTERPPTSFFAEARGSDSASLTASTPRVTLPA
jgi:hypothetical protein